MWCADSGVTHQNRPTELLDRVFNAPTPDAAREWLDNPPHKWREWATEPNGFHIHIHAAIGFDEASEGGGAPQVSAILTRREVTLGWSTGVLHLANRVADRNHIGVCRINFHVSNVRPHVDGSRDASGRLPHAELDPKGFAFIRQ